MRHNREEVIERTIREFELLDQMVSGLSDTDWEQLVARPEGKEPWTVKDALAHITHWKTSVVRSIRKVRRPPDERGLGLNEMNHLIYTRWHDRSPQEVVDWHRQVQADLLTALQDAPEEWFTGKEHGPEWPEDIDGHSAYHRVKDIERVLATKTK